MTARLRLGTRRSALALAQSGDVARALEAAWPGLDVELVGMVTEGDRTAGDLAPLGGKGLFTEELERGLLEGRLDLAVHSLKDLPVTLPEGLTIAAFPRRADPRDALISEVATSIETLPEGATILTGALRRRAQLLAIRPDLDVQPIRGNVDTRLRKWRQQRADGVILAAAGLDRLGLTDPISLGEARSGIHSTNQPADLPIHRLSGETFLPAPGQGTLALQVAIGSPAATLCAALADDATAMAARAERHLVRAFGGHCALPLAAWARREETEFAVTGWLGLPDGSHAVAEHVAAKTTETGTDNDRPSFDPERLAATCVDGMRKAGAGEILDRIHRLKTTPGSD